MLIIHKSSIWGHVRSHKKFGRLSVTNKQVKYVYLDGKVKTF